MPDYSDFDLDRSTAQAWDEFQLRLNEVLSLIDDSADLRIGTESGAGDGPFVAFSSPTGGVVRTEAASNAVISGAFQLGPDQLTQMEQLGWQPPTSLPPRPTPNFWAEGSQEQPERLSYLAVAALRDVYGVQHPVFLAPDHLAEVLQPAPPPLSTGNTFVSPGAVATVPGSQEHLNDLVDEELSELFGHRPIRDGEGDIAIRVGSTMIFLRTAPDGAEVVVFAAVVHDVEGRSRAAEVLNDLNVHARWVKFLLIRDRVFVSLSVPARPFVAAHLRQAVRIMSEVADGIDDELALKLRGRTTFDESGEQQ
ncbi:MAG TPA: hypothetical protein VEQ66_13375 [Propionibacteriaceae bacterium]|nr:hypothetical protein [Propionibacteriaceae bacterium]